MTGTRRTLAAAIGRRLDISATIQAKKEYSTQLIAITLKSLLVQVQLVILSTAYQI